ncbi:MAG: hypothetical protein ACRYGR_03990 [Janthinobacterium lividum]
MKNKKFNPYDVALDVDEQDIVDSFDNGEWQTVDNFEEQARLAQQTAAHSFEKKAHSLVSYHFEDYN